MMHGNSNIKKSLCLSSRLHGILSSGTSVRKGGGGPLNVLRLGRVSTCPTLITDMSRSNLHVGRQN